jgi:hypothetical protein
MSVRAEKLSTRAIRRAAVETGMRDTDPVATAASRPLTVIASGTSLLVAAFLTAAHPGDLARPDLMFLAFVFLGATCIVLVHSSNELRNSFTATEHILAVVLSWAAALLSALAQWPGNEFLRDDWGPYVIALTLVATSPYRSLGSLVVALVASTAFVSGLAVLQSSLMATTLPMTVFALLAAAPVVLLASAGIAYARVGVCEYVGADRDYTGELASGDPVEVTEHERRVMLLAGEVAPLFSWVVQRGNISAHDIERAGEISAAVRATMVHSANRSWIATATAEAVENAQALSARPSHAAARNVGQILVATRVWDSSDLSARMSFDQRTAVRALLEGIFVHDQVRPDSFAVRVLQHGGNVQLWIDASYGPGEFRDRTLRRVRARHLRKPLGPFLAIARASFPAVDFTTYSTKQSLKVTLRFSYGL